MNEHRRPLDQRLVPFLRVLLRGVPEVARTDGATDAVEVVAAADDVVLVPVHDAEELLPDVLGSSHRPSLDVCKSLGQRLRNMSEGEGTHSSRDTKGC